MRKLVLFTAALLCSAAPVLAKSAETSRAPANGECTMKENVSLNVNFNFRAASPVEAKQKFEARFAGIEADIKKAGFAKVILQSLNYSVNPVGDYDSDTGGYQVNGSANYMLDNADKSFALMEQFGKQRMQANVNVSKYRTGNCPDE